MSELSEHDVKGGFVVGGFNYEFSVKVRSASGTPSARDMVNVQMTMSFIQKCIDQAYLFCRKNRDYSPANIARAGELGVLIRCGDKFARLESLRVVGEPSVDESIEDTWQDIANYAVIARMVRSGLWPGLVPGWELCPGKKVT